MFVAIEVPHPDSAGAAPDDPTATPEHLTLRFLGEVPERSVLPIRSALELVARATAPFEMAFEGVGAFPTRTNPRVVWIGVTRGRDEVAELAARTNAALEPIVGGDDRERFVPHLTLFRVRSPGQRRRAQALLSGEEPPPPVRVVPVREICLKESTLTPHGAIHHTVVAWSLGG